VPRPKLVAQPLEADDAGVPAIPALALLGVFKCGAILGSNANKVKISIVTVRIVNVVAVKVRTD
jgi:hypothetical protein